MKPEGNSINKLWILSFVFSDETQLINQELMKRMPHKLLFFLSLVCLFSCKNRINSPITHFSSFQTERIEHSTLFNLEKYDILKPLEVIKDGEEYIFIDDKRDNFITKVNFQSNQFISGVNFGSGPQELNLIGSIKKIKDKVLIYDITKKEIFELMVNEKSLTIQSFHKINNYPQKLFSVNYINNNIIASGLFGDFWIGYIDFLNNELLSAIDFPEFEETNAIQDMQKSIIYLSTHITCSPNNKKIAVATKNAGVISLINIKDDQLEQYKQIKYYPPNFNVTNDGTIAYSKKGEIGFCNIDCDAQHIYLLYSGRTFETHGMLNHHCEHLLIYDWNGNPVKHYILDIPLFSMKFDNEKNTIYGIGYNPEGVFVEYNINSH